MGNIEDDMIEEFLFSDLLKHVEFLDPRTPIEIICGSKSGIRRHFMTHAFDLKNALMLMLIEAPALQKLLDIARKDVKILQEYIAGETLEAKPPRWEYIDIYFPEQRGHYTDQLNRMGAEGWELIQCDFQDGHALFKRPK